MADCKENSDLPTNEVKSELMEVTDENEAAQTSEDLNQSLNSPFTPEDAADGSEDAPDDPNIRPEFKEMPVVTDPAPEDTLGNSTETSHVSEEPPDVKPAIGELMEEAPRPETSGNLAEAPSVSSEERGEVGEDVSQEAQSPQVPSELPDVKPALEEISTANKEIPEAEGDTQAIPGGKFEEMEVVAELPSLPEEPQEPSPREHENEVIEKQGDKRTFSNTVGPASKKIRLDENAEKLGLVDDQDEDADDPGQPGEDDNSSSDEESTDSTPSAPVAPTAPTRNGDVKKFLPALRALRRGSLAKISRNDFEELIVQKVCEAITERHPDHGELRRRCQFLEEEAAKWKEMALSQRKQVRELQTVLNKFLAEVDNHVKGGTFPQPVRVTRSVGLQVTLGLRRLVQNAPKNDPIVRPKTCAVKSTAAPAPKKTPSPVKVSSGTHPMIRPKPVNKLMPAPEKQVISSSPINRASTALYATPAVHAPTPASKLTPLQPKSLQANAVIDLTDDGPPLGAVVPTPGRKLAFVVPSSPGQPQKFLIATPTTVSKAMPALMYKGETRIQPRSAFVPQTMVHPAPLPPVPMNQPHHQTWKKPPPRPALKISDTRSGIVLSWDMTVTDEHAAIKCYQLFAYQEGKQPATSDLWKQVGDVKALPLPMACTLSSFIPGYKYHFTVRAVDLHARYGPFSYPGSIRLKQ